MGIQHAAFHHVLDLVENGFSLVVDQIDPRKPQRKSLGKGANDRLLLGGEGMGDGGSSQTEITAEIGMGNAKHSRKDRFTQNVNPESGEGLPAANEITLGSESDLKISRIAEGFISLTLFEKEYSITYFSHYLINNVYYNITCILFQPFTEKKNRFEAIFAKAVTSYLYSKLKLLSLITSFASNLVPSDLLKPLISPVSRSLQSFFT